MVKLVKDLVGVVAGEVYPKVILAGADCPPELEAAARDAGALEVTPAPAAKHGKGG